MLFIPPAYPPPPSDGSSPPQRTAKEICEEAGLMTYIGEILYASQKSRSGKEEGLAWTREAVDIAEEQLRRKRGVDREARKTCSQCLGVGLGNWEVMVGRFAEEERRGKIGGKVGEKGSGWLRSAGIEMTKRVEGEEEIKGRWESEEVVVEERARRVRDLLASLKTKKTSLF